MQWLGAVTRADKAAIDDRSGRSNPPGPEAAEQRLPAAAGSRVNRCHVAVGRQQEKSRSLAAFSAWIPARILNSRLLPGGEDPRNGRGDRQTRRSLIVKEGWRGIHLEAIPFAVRGAPQIDFPPREVAWLRSAADTGPQPPRGRGTLEARRNASPGSDSRQRRIAPRRRKRHSLRRGHGNPRRRCIVGTASGTK